MPSLKVTPIPFRSSNLAIPTSPYSPRSPLADLSLPKRPNYTFHPSRGKGQLPVYAKPLTWMWQCHQCKQQYPLGATRRCLEDGHYFCSGTSIVRSRRNRTQKIVKKHRACASEFDYAAWKALGEWRRECMLLPSPSSEGKKDCWRNCDYPSECRWGSKVTGVTEVWLPPMPMVERKAPEKPLFRKKAVREDQQFSEMLIVQEKPEDQSPPPPPPSTFDALLSAINHPSVALSSLLGAASKKSKRKSASDSSSSPLKLDTVVEEDEDGDTLMGGTFVPTITPGFVAARSAELEAERNSRPRLEASDRQKSVYEEFEFGFGEDDTILQTGK